MLEEVTDWQPGQEIPVGRIRFDPPEAMPPRRGQRQPQRPLHHATVAG